MTNENLIRLIEQAPDIKKRFKTEYISLGKPAGKPAMQTPYQTIHNDEKYLLWKAEIEAELEKLPQSKTVQDIIHLFSKMGKNFSDDSTFAQLEAKLTVLGKTLSESVGEGSKMDRPHKLFISHSSKDADYVEVFVGLLEILGLRDEEIICSSVPPYCIPLGNKVYEWLVNEFQNSDLHVIYAFSKDYYSSTASLNEMGAAWAMKHKWTGVLLPGFQFNQLDEGNGQIFRLATLGSAVQVSTDGKQFMADNSQRESARWQEALDLLITWGWVKPVGRKGEVYEVTGTGYTKADWLKDDMCIDTSKEPLEELKQFEF